MRFAAPTYLWLLPAVLLPWWRVTRQEHVFASGDLLPRDRASLVLELGEKALISVALGALIVALAAPYYPDRQEERIGRGAQMVVLLDRSRSMDQPFSGPRGQRSEPQPAWASPQGPTKGDVARRLLSEFAARRDVDMIGMVVFSTKPIQVLPLTQKPEIIQAAIAAGNVGRGLAETNVGDALKRGLTFFEDRPYTGSRIVLLISDGAASLDLSTREQIRQLADEQRVSLYWLYIRTRNSPGIFDAVNSADERKGLYPQRALHRFFESLDVPYRVYEAEDPEALERAIADVSKLQNLPLHYQDTIPRIELTHWCYLAAALLLLPLWFLRWVEVEDWP